ncbi:hypothetical protein F4819DRAFT_479809 [Hypoxylon fuscum]|nr:hypothetical protein F4819DRAFT_479809 [Hypoxylon fuscum]
MSSVTTSIPTGAISEWCLVQRTTRSDLFVPNCANAFRNSTAATPDAFQSICCDGYIVDTAADLYAAAPPNQLPDSAPDLGPAHLHPVDLANLVCCAVAGTQTAALALTPSRKTACAPGTPATPLASLAATNAANASLYSVAYASVTSSSSADPEATVTNDLWGWATASYGASGTPMCFWANTASGYVDGVAEVTVPVTYVAPTSTSATETGSAAASTSSPSAAFSHTRTQGGKSTWATVLGLMVMGLFLS